MRGDHRPERGCEHREHAPEPAEVESNARGRIVQQMQSAALSHRLHLSRLSHLTPAGDIEHDAVTRDVVLNAYVVVSARLIEYAARRFRGEIVQRGNLRTAV